LKEKGYDKFERTDTAFQFPEGREAREFEEGKAAREQRASAFGKFVVEQSLKTDYALCIEFTLHLEKSWQEIYAVIVDAKGAVVWEESLQPDDSDFYRALDPGEVEQACGWICERLAPLMGLDQLPNKEPSEVTKEARRKKQAEAGPNPSERAAMKERLAVLEKTATSARVTVYPTRVGGDHTDGDSASRLVGFLNDAKLCEATAAKTGPVLQGEGWPNEAKVLWIFANAARDYVRANPPDSDYILFADYWESPRTKATWAVHFVVCDRAGDWVIVDLQNSHHPDFQRINPKTLADGDRLMFERLKTHLKVDLVSKRDINGDFEGGTYVHSSGAKMPLMWDGVGGALHYENDGSNGYIVLSNSDSDWTVAHPQKPAILLSDFGVTGGETVAFGADMIKLGGDGRVELKLEEYKNGGATANGISTKQISPTGSWATYKADFKIKPDSDSVILVLVAHNKGASYGFDNVTFTPIDARGKETGASKDVGGTAS
jgi:hypothetical protein